MLTILFQSLASVVRDMNVSSVILIIVRLYKYGLLVEYKMLQEKWFIKIIIGDILSHVWVLTGPVFHIYIVN